MNEFDGAYLDLITSQHKGKPKFMATVTALLAHSGDIFALAVYLDDEFDLDTAEGAQEDKLGEIVGASRTLPYNPANGASPVLDDENYRLLLKAKVARNLWKGGIDELREIWENLFGNPIVIQDNQDMTMDVLLEDFDNNIAWEMVQKGLIVPKPQSVLMRTKMLFHFEDSEKENLSDRLTLLANLVADLLRDVYPWGGNHYGGGGQYGATRFYGDGGSYGDGTVYGAGHWFYGLDTTPDRLSLLTLTAEAGKDAYTTHGRYGESAAYGEGLSYGEHAGPNDAGGGIAVYEHHYYGEGLTYGTADTYGSGATYGAGKTYGEGHHYYGEHLLRSEKI